MNREPRQYPNEAPPDKHRAVIPGQVPLVKLKSEGEMRTEIGVGGFEKSLLFVYLKIR